MIYPIVATRIDDSETWYRPVEQFLFRWYQHLPAAPTGLFRIAAVFLFAVAINIIRIRN